MSLDRLRAIHANPLQAERIAQPFTFETGVEASMARDPNAYIDQVRMIDPRYASSTGEKRNISRQQAQTGHLAMSELLIPALMNTCDELGITEPEYPFEHNAEFDIELDAILVTGGALTAYDDRISFAYEGPEVDTFIVGGTRPLEVSEIEALVAEGFKRDDFKTESDIATLRAEQQWASSLRDILPFIPRTFNPDNRDVIREFILRLPAIKRIGVVTTALYVPFTSYDAGAVSAEFDGAVDLSVYAGASDPAKVAKRNQNTYRSELARTLVGAARMYQEQERRR